MYINALCAAVHLSNFGVHGMPGIKPPDADGIQPNAAPGEHNNKYLANMSPDNWGMLPLRCTVLDSCINECEVNEHPQPEDDPVLGLLGHVCREDNLPIKLNASEKSGMVYVLSRIDWRAMRA